MSEKDIENLTYHEGCRLLNINPVLVARHFQYRVEVFFKEIVVDGSFGKSKYYAIRVEFQVYGLPHLRWFLWVANVPVLTSKSKEEYVTFVDQIVHAFLPDRDDPEIHDLVKLYLFHKHSRTCKGKYKNEPCKFKFGNFFSKRKKNNSCGAFARKYARRN